MPLVSGHTMVVAYGGGQVITKPGSGYLITNILSQSYSLTFRGMNGQTEVLTAKGEED